MECPLSQLKRVHIVSMLFTGNWFLFRRKQFLHEHNYIYNITMICLKYIEGKKEHDMNVGRSHDKHLLLRKLIENFSSRIILQPISVCMLSDAFHFEYTFHSCSKLYFIFFLLFNEKTNIVLIRIFPFNHWSGA